MRASGKIARAIRVRSNMSKRLFLTVLFAALLVLALGGWTMQGVRRVATA
jgi:hypothetical protein